MRLLVDTQCVASGSALRGIGRYALSLTAALAATAAERGHQVEVLLASGARQDRLLAARAALESAVGPRAIHVFDAAWPWQAGAADERLRPAAETAYAAAVRSLGPDALLVASAFERDDEAVLSVGGSPADPPTACVLYDLMPALEPATYLMGPEAATYWRRLDHLRRCQGLLAISDHSARQATRVLGANCPEVSTIHGGPYPSGAFPGFEPAGDDRPELVLPDRFVLTVGGDHPRKNLDRLVEAWGRVPAPLRHDVPLVLACRLNPGTERRLMRAAARAGVSPSELLLTGRLSERRLQDLYTRADLFVFPSLEEGLGMPPLEAAAAGCPALLARGSSLSELTSREAAFFNPLDAADMATAMVRALTDESVRQALRDAAHDTARAFTWQQTGRRAWAALEILPTRSAEERPSCHGPVRLSDQQAVAGLAAAPAPVRLDIDLDAAVPAESPGALGLPVGLRAALAPATALLAPTTAAASAALRAGLLDQPVLTDENQLPLVVRHDWYAAYADGLARLSLTEDVAGAVVQGALRPPRWMLERPRPVWLLLCETAPHAGLSELAADAGIDLVQARPPAVSLAALVDVVLCPAAIVVAGLQDALARARTRGARAVAVHERTTAVATPGWCDDVVLAGALEDPAAWRAHLRGDVRTARTTGWPWRAGD